VEHEITGVEAGSVAEAHGLRHGDTLLSMDGEPVADQIDYQAHSAKERLTLALRRANGVLENIRITKEDWQPLGLTFGSSMTLTPRTCHNKCVFCFIDQMRPGSRESLYVKDDDWRFSLMMGNFVTLTNVSEAEFARIVARRASPLYVSVHTTNPALRCRMMNNRFAGDILTRLERLRDAGIRFHCQIVCCPGLNNGEELLRTLTDLRGLAPATLSVAVVPVGLTKYRKNLFPLTLFNGAGARALLDMLRPFQAECLAALGTRLVFASDEFYCLAGEPVPPYDWYEDFPQIENGVGLLAQLTDGFRQAAENDTASPVPKPPRKLVVVSGVSAAPHIRQHMERYAPPDTQVCVVTVYNRFFGETITVTGLLTGGDTLDQLPPDALADADAVLISCNMLRHERDLFLDNMTLTEFESRLPAPVRIVEDGYDFYEALRGR
jgi:putative radical SAM enzyme (TIGR03279 family)